MLRRTGVVRSIMLAVSLLVPETCFSSDVDAAATLARNGFALV